MSIERWGYALISRIRALVLRRRAGGEIDDEIRFHLEQGTRHNVASGLTPEDARLAAVRAFGGATSVGESCEDVRRVPIVESVLQDVKYAVRTLRRSPGFTAVAAATLALGIGANAGIFGLVNGILLAPLPYEQPRDLVKVTATYPRGAFVALRQQIRTMRVAAYAEGHERNLSGIGEPARLRAVLVSSELFSVLGARPQLGRTFEPGEDTATAPESAILSDAAWDRYFARDPSIVGRTIVVDGASAQVVGVMPAGFAFPSADVDLWTPFHADARHPATYWAGDFMPVIGRLATNATPAHAHAEVRSFQSRVRAAFPWPMPESWNADVTVVPLQDDIVGDVRPRLLLLLGATGLVLLIACANVANLTISRSTTREREIGIRAALGAGQRRIARQLVTESLVLAAVGGALGVIVANQGLLLLKRALPADTPRLAEAHVDWRVLLFTGALVVATGVIFGLAPAIQASRATLTAALRSSSRSSTPSTATHLRHALVVGEIALAVFLVCAAGLFMRSFWMLSRVDTGFSPEHVLSARISPDVPFCADAGRCLTFYRRVVEMVQAVPGVRAAALVNTPPLEGKTAKRSLELEQFVVPSGQTAPLFWLNAVTPDYFRALNIATVSGRGFSAGDDTGAPVAVISASTAQRFWPGHNPIGMHVRFVGERDWRTIVGVVADIRAYDLQSSLPRWMTGTIYVPYGPAATMEDGRVPPEMTLVVQTATTSALTTAALRHIVSTERSGTPVSDLRPMRTVVQQAAATPASTASLFASFAGVAILLGTIGVYGVLSFLVSRRTREIGIRMALGARRQDVLWPIMKEGLVAAGAGISLGLFAALAGARGLSGQLYGISPVDPITYVGVATLMAGVTAAAFAVPALRATRIDPVTALHRD